MDKREPGLQQRWAAWNAALADEVELMSRVLLKREIEQGRDVAKGVNMAETVAKVLVERCPHESETGIMLEYTRGPEARRFLSCGLPACNQAAADWWVGTLMAGEEGA